MSKELREFIPDLLQSINEIMPKGRTYRRDGSPVWLNDKERSQLDGVQIRVNKVMPVWYGLSIYAADGAGQSTSAEVIPGNEFIGAYKTAVSALGAEVLPLLGRKDLSDVQKTHISLFKTIISDRGDEDSGDLSGLTGFLTTKIAQLRDEITAAPSILRRNALEELINKYRRSREILEQDSTNGQKIEFDRRIILPSIPDIDDFSSPDNAATLAWIRSTQELGRKAREESTRPIHGMLPGYHPYRKLEEQIAISKARIRDQFRVMGDDFRELKERVGRFPLRALLAALGIVVLAWLLSKDSSFIRRPDTNPAGQITITQLYPPINPDAVVGGSTPAASEVLPKPQESSSPFTTFINSRVIVKEGDNVWDLVKKAQIAAFGEGWVNSENGVERADAVAGIVVELMEKRGLNPGMLQVGQEFSLSDLKLIDEEMGLMEAAINSGSVDQYQLEVAPAVNKLLLP